MGVFLQLLDNNVPEFKASKNDKLREEMAETFAATPERAVKLLSSRSSKFAAFLEDRKLKIVTDAIEYDKLEGRRNVIENYVRPGLKAVGTVGGALGGAALGSPTGPGALVTGAAGAVGGNVLGDNIADAIAEFAGVPRDKGGLAKEIAYQSGNIAEGAAAEMGGQVLGKGLEIATPIVKNGLKSVVGAGKNIAQGTGKTIAKPFNALTRPAADSAEVIAAAERQGIDLSRAESSGNRLTSGVEYYLKNSFTGSGVAEKFGKKQAGQIDDAVNALKSKSGADSISLPELGENIIKGKTATGAKYKEHNAKLYNQVNEKIGHNAVTSNNTRKAISELAEENANLADLSSPALKYSKIFDNENLTFKDLQTVRGKIYENIQKELTENGYSQTPTVRDLTRLSKAISKDLDTAATNAWIGSSWRRANKYHGYGKEIFDDNSLLKTLEKDPEKIPGLILKPNSETNVKRIMQVLPDETKNQVRRYVLDAVFDDGGSFGFSKMSSWLPKYRSTLEATLGKKNPILKDLEDLEKVSRRAKDVYAKGGNPSGTGRYIDAAFSGGLLFTGNIPALLFKSLGERVATKAWYSSPYFRKAVIDVAKKPERLNSPLIKQLWGRIGGRGAVIQLENMIKGEGKGATPKAGAKPTVTKQAETADVAVKGIEDKATRYFERVANKDAVMPYMGLGKIPKKTVDDIRRVTNEDVSDYTYMLYADDLKHAINEHGIGGKKTGQGQIPLTKEDMPEVVNIVKSYDTIIPSDIRGPNNNKRFSFVKKKQNNMVIIVEMRPRKQRLVPTTIYKIGNKNLSDDDLFKIINNK